MMEWCADMMIVIFKASTYLLSVGFKVVRKWSILKRPFDKQKKPYRFWKDFWPRYNDNSMVWAFGGALGAITAGAWVGPIISKFVELDPTYELAMELLFVSGGTLLGSWLFGLLARD